MMLDYADDKEDTSELLMSEEDEDDDGVVRLQSWSQAGQPHLLPAWTCILCANVPHPSLISPGNKSRYEGKKLPRATGMAKQLLPVFPELLEEVSVPRKGDPFSSKAPIQGASSMDFEYTEKHGILCMPPWSR